VIAPRHENRQTHEDILYHKADGIANHQPPSQTQRLPSQTVFELYDAFADAREDTNIGVVLFTGAGPHTDGKYAFCAGGDQSVRGTAGYVDDGCANVLDLQRLIRSMPKVVIALGMRLVGTCPHLICDLTIADNNFGQTGPKVGSLTVGLVPAILPGLSAREIWFLCRHYTAAQALEINCVVLVEQLERHSVG